MEVTSATALCSKMTKLIWHELMSTPQKIHNDNDKKITEILCQTVIDSIKEFNPLSPSQKQQLIHAMYPMTFKKDAYLCNQELYCAGFYIITKGKCKITIADKTGNQTVEGILQPGDYFGE